MSGYTVFHVEQIEDLPAHYYSKEEQPSQSAADRIEKAERFFANTNAEINHDGNGAFYAIGPDRIHMPPFEFFKDPESYYATLAHETTRWTRHPYRLDRNLGRKRWGMMATPWW